MYHVAAMSVICRIEDTLLSANSKGPLASHNKIINTVILDGECFGTTPW